MLAVIHVLVLGMRISGRRSLRERRNGEGKRNRANERLHVKNLRSLNLKQSFDLPQRSLGRGVEISSTTPLNGAATAIVRCPSGFSSGARTGSRAGGRAVQAAVQSMR